MNKNELEDKVLAFINKEYDILICTTIIESGIDMPNVNTLIVEDADKMDFIYVQYDRFMGTLKSDASILGQIKDKRTLILNYKQNGSSKTAMFQLEGLEAIYNAITQ